MTISTPTTIMNKTYEHRCIVNEPDVPVILSKDNFLCFVVAKMFFFSISPFLYETMFCKESRAD